MPWSIKMENGKHCVIKDDTGETVNCYDEKADALARMKALYASEDVEKSISELEKMYYGESGYADTYYSYGGATSFSELDIVEDQKEKEHELQELVNKLSCLSNNILSNPFIDRKSALQALSYEFYTKLNEISSDNSENDNMEKAEWTKAYINDLPDSSFMYIESGGKKDSEGKTEPRALRHLPYKDAQGKIDLPHVRNITSRANQIKLKDGSTISKDVADKLIARAQKILGESKTEKIWITGIEKAYDDEKHLVYGIVLNPDIVDSQGDITSAEEIEKSAHNFFIKSRMLDHNHKITLDPSVATPVESYVAPVDFMIGEKLVKKGAWVMVTKVFDDSLWKQIKENNILSYSIAGYGKRKSIEIEE